MTDAEFIKENYDSFVDNVLLNQSPEFWALVAGVDGIDTPDAEGLRSAMKEWRGRIELNMHDPHQTEEWWAAIDRDIEYQNEFRRDDE